MGFLCPHVEEATFSWFCLMQEHNATITNDMLFASTTRFYVGESRKEGERALNFFMDVYCFKKKFSMRGYLEATQNMEAWPLQMIPKRFKHIQL